MTADAVSPVSRHISTQVAHTAASDRWLWAIDGERIAVPPHHAPAREFIEYHSDVVFQR